MSQYTISAIQQIGIGTKDFRKSWDWYIENFGFDIKILEDDTIAERMLPYTGGKARKRHACIAVNLQGGGGLEIWQYSEREPKDPCTRISIGDLGIFAAKIKCRNIKSAYKEMVNRGVSCSKPCKDPSGTNCLFVEDPFGNSFQLIERNDIFIEDHKNCGGIIGAMIGVSDMSAALNFYQEVLGYDKITYDAYGTFEDWTFMPSSGERYRRVLLTKSKKAQGAFTGLLGSNSIELVQALERTPHKIYEDRYWGDPGFIQICYDVTGMRELEKFCAAKGFPFTVDSCPNGERFDMGEASGHFTYIEDPDGTLIEFVETHKIPLLSKLGIYIDMDRRDRGKTLPKWMFRIIGMVSRQTKRQ